MKKIKKIIINTIFVISTVVILKLLTFFNVTDDNYYLDLVRIEKQLEIKNEISEIQNKIIEIEKLEESIILKLLEIDENEDNELNIFNNNDTTLTDIERKMLVLSTLTSKKLLTYHEINNRLVDFNIKHYPSISPVRTKNFLRISSEFGWRIHPIYKKPIFHQGVDIVVKQNVNIYSTINGYIDKVMYSKYGYGNRVVIKNESGYEVLYAHLSDYIFVREGDYVKKGQLIGKSGNTGTSTGNHLHYEIRKNEIPKNPLSYFKIY